jgi:hypothetical protein
MKTFSFAKLSPLRKLTQGNLTNFVGMQQTNWRLISGCSSDNQGWQWWWLQFWTTRVRSERTCRIIQVSTFISIDLSQVSIKYRRVLFGRQINQQFDKKLHRLTEQIIYRHTHPQRGRGGATQWLILSLLWSLRLIFFKYIYIHALTTTLPHSRTGFSWSLCTRKFDRWIFQQH